MKVFEWLLWMRHGAMGVQPSKEKLLICNWKCYKVNIEKLIKFPPFPPPPPLLLLFFFGFFLWQTVAIETQDQCTELRVGTGGGQEREEINLVQSCYTLVWIRTSRGGQREKFFIRKSDSANLISAWSSTKYLSTITTKHKNPEKMEQNKRQCRRLVVQSFLL